MEIKRGSAIKKSWIINAAFVIGCLGLLVILLFAPEETTSKLPHDTVHEEFHKIKSKKEADKQCVTCHTVDPDLLLPADHPPPYRCLFCHKRD